MVVGEAGGGFVDPHAVSTAAAIAARPTHPVRTRFHPVISRPLPVAEATPRGFRTGRKPIRISATETHANAASGPLDDHRPATVISCLSCLARRHFPMPVGRVVVLAA